MDWSDATLWWALTGVLVVAELLTGSFYLLMLAIGLAAGALAAHAGLSPAMQMVVAALVGGGATAAWHRRRQRDPQRAPAEANRDVNLDIGERVRVESWQPGGRADVHHRGARWSARYAGSGEPEPGEYVIRGVEGNRLLLDR